MVVEGNILNGQQLISLRSKETKDLPVIGQKEFQPTNSWLEKKQIQNALGDRKALLEEERVEKWSALSSAEWIPDVKKAKVIKKVGKAWENLGHHSNDEDWLFPEEALLLLETNALELVFNEIPLSIERGYVTLLHEDTGCTLNEYRVFSHLVRLGYKLFRHLAEVSVTRYEKEIHLDQHVLKQKRTYNTSVINNEKVIAIDVDNSSVCAINTNIVDAAAEKNDHLIISVFEEDADNIHLSGAFATSVNHDENSNKQLDNNDRNTDLSVGQSQDKETNEVIHIDIDESVQSSDVLYVTGKNVIDQVDTIQDKTTDICVDDDDDDIIEIPVDKSIVINEISSSSSEDDDDVDGDMLDDDVQQSSIDDDEDDDSSVISQRSNSNWKRNHSSIDKVADVIDVSESPPPPQYAVRTNYVTFNEFLFDASQNNQENEVIELSDDDNTVVKKNNVLGKELEKFYKEIEVIDLDSELEDASTSRSKDINNISKKEILSLFPNLKNGAVNVIKTPPSYLLPPNIKPSRNEYSLTFSTSDILAHNYNNTSFSSNNQRLPQNNVRTQSYYHLPRSHNRPYYQSRNRSVNTWNPWMFNENVLQNQFTSQICAMATGMIQIASTMLSHPFVQQTIEAPRIPSLFYNQSYSQSSNIYRPRFNSFNDNGMSSVYNSNPSLHMNHSNMVMYNSQQTRGQCNTVQSNYNSNGINNHNFNVDQNYRQNFNRTNFNQSYGEQNTRFSLQQQQHVNISASGGSNFLQQSVDNSYQRNSGYNREAESSRSHGEDNSDNWRTGNNYIGMDESIQNQNRNNRNDLSERSSNYNQNRFSNNSRFNTKRPFSHRNRSRFNRKRYFNENISKNFIRQVDPNEDNAIIIDTEGDPSVFVDDIPVPTIDDINNSIDNPDFIPFSNNSNSNRSFNNTDVIDFGGNDFIVMDDINFDDVRDVRGRGRGVQKNFRGKRKRRKFKNYNWGINYDFHNNSNNKRQRIDISGNSGQNDGIEVINDSMISRNKNTSKESRDNLQNSKENSSVNKTHAKKRKRNSNALEGQNRAKNEKLTKKQKRLRFANKIRQLSSNKKNEDIEVIDIEIDDEPVNVKTENVEKTVDIKTEKNKNQHKTSSINSISQIRRDIDDETSVNSLISNAYSCVSTGSSCIIKFESGVTDIKQESAVVKNEKEITAVPSSPIVGITTTTAAAAASVKIENIFVKTENNDHESLKENVKQEPSNIKNENVSDSVNQVLETNVKQGKGMNHIQNEIIVPVKSERINNIEKIPDTSNIEITGKVNENFNVNKSNQTDKENAIVNTDLSKSIQVENEMEEQILSWAQLKQKQPSVTASVAEERNTQREIQEEEDEEDEDEEENDDEEEEIQPIITAKDCTSVETVLSALQIIGTAEFTHTDERRLKVSYDVYIPNIPLKKSSRGLPNYRVVVMDFSDAVPTASEMAELSSRFEDGVPILIALVLPDSLSFFTAATIKLPTDDGS
ncbi:uncharacterized protein LOC142330564 [Lycorma delicatula]|uniref:uncharacterized protein LOC142330564 n=1 Tax=Lycorma delicatula TaxID=130591 RepID=UPI003F5115CD